MTTPAQPDPGRESAETHAHTQQAARDIAAAAASSMENQGQEAPEGPESLSEGTLTQEPTQGTPEGQEGLTGEPEGFEEGQQAEGEEPQVEVEGVEGEEAEETQPSPDLAQLQNLHESLLKQGVNLELDLENLDPSLYEPATSLMDAAYNSMQGYTDKANQFDEARLGYEGLMSRLEQQPEQILLAIALDKPQVFEKAAGLFSEMQESEDIKSQVVREVETAARQANVDRREALLNEQQIRGLADRIEGEISRSCRLKGVDEELATQMVEKEIRLAKAENRVFDPSQVAQVVSSLRPKAPAPKAPKHVAPKQVQKSREAATAPASGSTPSQPGAAGQKEQSGAVSFPDSSGHNFRSLVGEAFKKTFSKER